VGPSTHLNVLQNIQLAERLHACMVPVQAWWSRLPGRQTGSLVSWCLLHPAKGGGPQLEGGPRGGQREGGREEGKSNRKENRIIDNSCIPLAPLSPFDPSRGAKSGAVRCM